MSTPLGLEDDAGQSVSLKSVRMEGRVEGLLLTMQVSQRYRNESADTIEATYTFPAGWGANLLGFSVTLNGKKCELIHHGCKVFFGTQDMVLPQLFLAEAVCSF